ncbi:MAG: DNA polymerase III subunit chi [Tepidimonas taiwanensis]|nr:DNA polymerase III subunit chi [Tepidimonas taiwanensis]
MEVAFHLNVPAAWPERSSYLCRLLAKAHASRARVWVVIAEGEAEPLDVALWALPENDFVPHVRSGEPALLLLRHSPIVIATPGDAVAGERSVLVNAQSQWPAVLDATAAFKRVIEVVSDDENDKAAARQRWRRYQAMGLTPVVYDRAARPPRAATGENRHVER